jgi:putative transposase
MPQGLRCFHHTGQPHFITFTCYHRLPKLDTGESRDLAVAALEHARVKYRFRVYAFVVM